MSDTLIPAEKAALVHSAPDYPCSLTAGPESTPPADPVSIHWCRRATTYYRDFTGANWWTWDPFTAGNGASSWVGANAALDDLYFRRALCAS